MGVCGENGAMINQRAPLIGIQEAAKLLARVMTTQSDVSTGRVLVKQTYLKCSHSVGPRVESLQLTRSLPNLETLQPH